MKRKGAINSYRRAACVVPLIFLCTVAPSPGVSLGKRLRSMPDRASETYRLKIENAPFGRIEISTDGGKHYRTIGRVTREALGTRTQNGTDEKGTVWKSSRDEITFLTAPGRSVSLRPQRLFAGKGKGRKKLPDLPEADRTGAVKTVIESNLASGTGVFGDLLPTPGSPVKLLNGRGEAETFSEIYKPKEGDTYYIRVALADEKGEVKPGETLAEEAARLADDYKAGAVLRAKATGRKIVSGTLTLKAALPSDEPDPIQFVTFLIDGEEVSTSNAAPFSYDWDTRRAEPGEHVVEVKAFSRSYRLLTQSRLLLVVKNR